MFFKKTVLKRMLKSAYTGAGLTVGHTPETDEEEEGYYLSSGWWVLWFNAGMFPKEAKAAVIELCGELPAVGEVFKAEKDFGNQYEIEQKEIFNLPEAPFVYWGNDCCYLMAGRRTSDGETEAEFWKYLEGTEIV